MSGLKFSPYGANRVRQNKRYAFVNGLPLAPLKISLLLARRRPAVCEFAFLLRHGAPFRSILTLLLSFADQALAPRSCCSPTASMHFAHFCVAKVCKVSASPGGRHASFERGAPRGRPTVGQLNLLCKPCKRSSLRRCAGSVACSAKLNTTKRSNSVTTPTRYGLAHF